MSTKPTKNLHWKQEHILNVMAEIEGEEPDISTERLIEMTQTRARVSHEAVMNALEADARRKGELLED